MSQLDNEIIDFRDSMAKVAQFVKGGETTDVVTPGGTIPSLSKIAKGARDMIASLQPDISNRLRVDADGGYTEEQKAQARANLGLEHVGNTAPEQMPISQAQQQAFDAVNVELGKRELLANKNKEDGYVGLSGLKVIIQNLLVNTQSKIANFLISATSQARTWQLPDKDGVIALVSDITGNNTGQNTGDETTATIRAKLQIETLSGANTGDETEETILAKLQITEISGVNTGDETRERIVNLLGYDPIDPALIGHTMGVGGLDENGEMYLTQLPSEVKNFAKVAGFEVLPNPGSVDTIYMTLNDGFIYHWTGSEYSSIGSYVQSTNDVPEGTLNLYFQQQRVRDTQLANVDTSDSNPLVIGDKLSAAFGKLQAQIFARKNATDDLASVVQSNFDNALAGLELVDAAAEKKVNKATNFSQVDDTLYPSVKAVNDQLNLKEKLINKVINFNSISDTLYPSVKAVKTFVESLLVGVLKDCGNWDASGNAWPATGGTAPDGSIRKSDFWYVSVPGLLGGVQVNVGDSFRAMVNNPGQTAANWAILEGNVGYVPENAANRGVSGGYPGLSDLSLIMRSGAGAIASLLTSTAIVARTWTLPDKDGMIALLSDVTGTNSGTNTGDETKTTIENKLAGSLRLSGVTPYVDFIETDQTLPLGKWRAIVDGGAWYLNVNTAAAGDFSTQRQAIQIPASGVVGLNYGASTPYLTLAQADPVLYFDETDQTGAVGKMRLLGAGGQLRADVNTAGPRDFSTFKIAWRIDSNARVDFPSGVILSGAAALGPTQNGTFSYEYPAYRFYIGDGTGYKWAFSKRVGSVTTDLVTIDDNGNFTSEIPAVFNNTATFKSYVNAGSAGSGGQFRVTDDSGQLRWWYGLSGTGGSRDLWLYDPVNNRQIFTVSYQTGQFNIARFVAAQSGMSLASSNTVSTTRVAIASVDTSIDEITTAAAHGFVAGDYVMYIPTGNHLTIGTSNTAGGYFISTSGATKLKFHLTREYALLGINPVDIQSVGPGSGIVAGAANVITMQMGQSSGGNSWLDVFSYRHSVGTDWNSVGTRLQMRTDYTQQGYLEFNPPGNAYGVRLGAKAGSIQFQIADLRHADIVGPADPTTTANWLRLRATASGDIVALEVQSATDPNASMRLTPLGTGHVQVDGPLDQKRGTDIATAGTLNLNARTGDFFTLTGTVPITAVTLSAGASCVARCGSNQQLTQSATLLLPGVTQLNTRAGDFLVFRGDNAGVVHVNHIPLTTYSRPDNQASVTANSATTTLDLSTASSFKVSLQASTTFAFNFANVPPLVNQVFSFALTIVNDGTAGRGVSFPAGVKWAGGVVPPRTTAANARDDWYFYSEDGVNWVGSLANQDVK